MAGQLLAFAWPGGSPENTGLIIAVVFGAYFAALWLAAVVWTGRDIRLRSDDPVTQFVAVLIVLALNFPGWVLYRVLRPTHTIEQQRERELEEQTLLHDLREIATCPRCGARVGDDFVACPLCAATLRFPCPGCQRPLEAGWNFCPWCAQTVVWGEPEPELDLELEPEPELEPAPEPGPELELEPEPATAPAGDR